MKNSEQHTPEYKKKLMKEKQNIIDYLQKKTGYFIKLQVQYDKTLGYRYSAMVSLNNFETYSKWVLENTSKLNIKKELLSQILNVDWKNKKMGQSLEKSKMITKKVSSIGLTIECCNCSEDKNVKTSFHRNIVSPLFKNRGGYCYLCFDCANTRAAEIARDKDFHTALVFLCSIYDRPYVKSLSDEIATTNLSPVEMFGQYMRRVNLNHSVKSKGSTFANSDIFDCENIKDLI